jgi:hypothetical protein
MLNQDRKESKKATTVKNLALISIMIIEIGVINAY